MAKLIQYQVVNDTTFSQMQSTWAKEIEPVIANPCNRPILLKKVSLVSGTNVINHTLGQALQGWKIVRQRAAASVYDSQDSNNFPALTLILVSSAPVVCDLEVF